MNITLAALLIAVGIAIAGLANRYQRATKMTPEAGQTSGPEPSACCTDTRTPRDTSEDA